MFLAVAGPVKQVQFAMVCPEPWKNWILNSVFPLRKMGTCAEIHEKLKERKPDNLGQEKDSNSQNVNTFYNFLSQPLGTPTEGFVFLLD
jgi:hypothetical protein